MISGAGKYVGIFILLLACGQQKGEEFDPQQAIDDCIIAHGGKIFENSRIEFDFRGRHYERIRNQGIFSFTREFHDSSGTILDRLSNEGLNRTIDGKEIILSDKWKKAYSNSVNSVIYFALLPFRLNDQAVSKKSLGLESINGENYQKIFVEFQQENGGEDYTDKFVFWINISTREMDFFAYSFSSDGGGLRFREAVNKRKIGGILFQDYNNFKENNPNLLDMASEFEKGELPFLSEIKLENISVKEWEGN